MRKILLTLLTTLLCFVGAQAVEYALVSDPTGTPALTSNFNVPSLSLNQSTPATIDGINFKKAIKFGSTQTTFSGKYAGQNGPTYNVKTTSTTFTVYVGGATGTLYFSKIAEGATTTTVENKTVSTNPQKLSFTVTSTTNTTVGFSVSSTSMYIYQIIADETGTAHKQPGEAGYTLNLNKGRYAANNGSTKTGSIEGMELVLYANYQYTSTASAELSKNTADTYIKFTTGASPVNLKVTYSNGTPIVNTSKSTTGGVALTSNTAQALSASTTYWIVNTHASNRAAITKIAFEAAAACSTPAAPSAMAASSTTSSGTTLTITDAANAASYDIYYSTSSTAPDGETEATTTSTSKTKALTGLTASTTYYVWVRSVCDESNKSDWVALTGSTFTTLCTSHTVTAATNNVSYGTAAAASTTVCEGSTTTVTATPKSGYSFVSWAVSGTGSSLSSTSTNPTTLTMGTANATVTATFGCATPSAPSALVASSTTSSGTTLTITDAANTNNYEIYYSTSSTAPEAGTSATTTSTSKTKALTGLSASTTYYVWVRSVCDSTHKSSWTALTGSTFTTDAACTDPSLTITLN